MINDFDEDTESILLYNLTSYILSIIGLKS